MSLKTILTIALLVLFGIWVLLTGLSVFNIILAAVAFVLALVVALDRG